MEASWWERLTEGETGSFSYWARFSKSLIQFSVDVQGYVPSCFLTWGQTMVEVMKIMETSFKRSQAFTAALSPHDPATGHHWPMPLPETPGHSWACLGQSLVGSLPLSSGSWCAQGSVCALQESVSQSCVGPGGSMLRWVLLTKESRVNTKIFFFFFDMMMFWAEVCLSKIHVSK